MITHFNITLQGTRHIERGDPCQDFSASQRIHLDRFGSDLVLAAIADGVGSCMFSQYGAETAVTSFLSCLVHNLNRGIFELTDEFILRLLEKAFRYALSQVSVKAEKMELPFMEFDSTLTGVIFDGKNLWFGHVGDDGVVVLYADGTYEMITERHEGEESGSLFPLICQEKWQFGKAPKEVASMVLMTDGVLNYCVDGRAMNNRVYYPFLGLALAVTAETDEQAEKLRQDWEDFLRGEPDEPVGFRNRITTDDISFVLIENPEVVATLPEIKFDQGKWDEDTKKRREEIDEKLYANYRKYKKGQQGILQDQGYTGSVDEYRPGESDDKAPEIETIPSEQLWQDEPRGDAPHIQGVESGECKKPPKPRGRVSSYIEPTRGTVIHVSSDVQLPTPIMEVFGSAFSAGKEIRECMSQMWGKHKESPEYNTQASTPEPEAGQETQNDK